MTLLVRAIDRLLASGLSPSEIADALGITDADLRTLRASRPVRLLEEAPADWYQILAEMAWEKGGLEPLAHELERT
jgi:hypothetical protein